MKMMSHAWDTTVWMHMARLVDSWRHALWQFCGRGLPRRLCRSYHDQTRGLCRAAWQCSHSAMCPYTCRRCEINRRCWGSLLDRVLTFRPGEGSPPVCLRWQQVWQHELGVPRHRLQTVAGTWTLIDLAVTPVSHSELHAGRGANAYDIHAPGHNRPPTTCISSTTIDYDHLARPGGASPFELNQHMWPVPPV